MILVDKDIRERGIEIIDGYDPANVGAISYDLTLDYVIDHTNDKEVTIFIVEVAYRREVYKNK